MSVRILLANSKTNLPVILDEVLSLARRLGEATQNKEDHLEGLKSLLEQDVRLLDLVSPHALIENAGSPKQTRTAIVMDIWIEAVCLLLRLFPDTGSHSFCKSFGDVSPLALETIFDKPIQDLELLLLRLRSVLTPSLLMNEEIASVVLEHLENNKLQ
jgi:hypothetical protein